MQQYLLNDGQLDYILNLINMSAPANVISGINLYNGIKQYIDGLKNNNRISKEQSNDN